ncbi:MAG TPA: M28 family metallopeptidase [Chloroflexia bacterium]|nr:M28 family metallopeptidase [Chloroflexia bacterium]
MTKTPGRKVHLLLVLMLAGVLWLAAFIPAGAASSGLSQPEVLNRNTPDTAEENSTAQLKKLVDAVSSDRMVAQIKALSQSSRCATDPGHSQAGDYLVNELKKLGFNPVIQPFQSTGTRGAGLRNIVVRRAGSNPRAVHLLTAHWDSSPTRLFPPVCNGLAPGANDNGSGVASLLEIARLLGPQASEPSPAFQDDLELVFFDGEEFGYLGSQYLVSHWASDSSVNPLNLPLGAVVNLDMVGYSGGKARGEIWAVTEDAASQALAREGQDLAVTFGIQAPYSLYTIGDKFPANHDPNRNSDQRSFWDAGQGAAIFLTEDVADNLGGDPRWHTPGDLLYLPDATLRLDPALLADSARLAFLLVANRAHPVQSRLFSIIDPLFERNWSRADRPVKLPAEARASVGRSWLWGPQPDKVVTEPYSDSPDGTRPVVYFDKARMELNDPSSGRVTNGLLVTEMVTGRLQLGDNRFMEWGPSRLQVAGDSNQRGQNLNAPTYASFKALVEAGPSPAATGEAVTATINKEGKLSIDPALGSYARNSFYAPDTGHNIPDVFWNYFSTPGLIYDPLTGKYREDQIFDWLATTGLPITEAYWVGTEVDGSVKDVLVQLFQRRILTFTPSNSHEWQVEMGNVGQHYLLWRYNLP